MNFGAAHDRGRHESDALTATVPVASFAQRRMWFLDQLARNTAANLLPLALRIRGALDVAALERALAGIVERHEVLRTRFVAIDGEPVPQVEEPGCVRLRRVEVGGVDELFDRELSRGIDLATEPPIRMTLARTAPDEHLLLLVVHHIAVDGWSWDVLLRELAAGYRGEEVTRPALQYVDFAREQRNRLTGARMERLLGYWRTRLAGVAPLALPTDRPRPPFWDSSGDVVRFSVPAEVVSEVDRVARERRATRYMLLFAVYQALLSHYTGQTDIAVCTTMADRNRAELADLIGPFVNTIVLRTDLSGDPTFDDLLHRVREHALKDFSHAEAPFDRVVGEVGAERDLSRHPLAQASFTLLTAEHTSVELPGLTVELVPPPLNGAPLDVFLDLKVVSDGSISARLQYATALFDADTMRQFSEGYVELLRAALAAPQTPIGELTRRLKPLPGRRLVEQWSRACAVGDATPTRDVPPFVVSGAPDDIALICGDHTVTYHELDHLVGGLATTLTANGVTRET
ncbi:MAG TPA: condensation domain-containing protein, partial [Micromonosporaceae bacterium]